MTKYLGIHETLELLEVMTFKSVTLTKATAMGLLVKDLKLKEILSNEVTASTSHINRMKELLTNREEDRA
jgi:similar to spore coat protein